MATSTIITVAEYLRTAYYPDRDYVDGVLQKRNLGEIDHGWIQAKLATIFFARFRQTGRGVLAETRMQIGPTRFRVPDLMMTNGKPVGRIITAPPLLCIEILTPEDRISRVNERVQEYLQFGVPLVWVVDPRERTIHIHRARGAEQASDPVKVDGTDMEVPFSEIFE